MIDFPWSDLVELWLDACNAFNRGDIKPKLQFYQKRRAIFKDESSLLRSGLHLKRIPYEINTAWPAEKARFMTCDRQEEDAYWWSIRMWGEELAKAIERVQSKYHIFGHIHDSYGQRKIGKTTYINASICNEAYEPVNEPIVIEL